MRKGICSAATAVVLLSIATIGGYSRALAAPTTVSMVDGDGDPTTQWKFVPAEITVPAGTTVKWHNTGKQSHTVTADDGSFDSGYVAEGGDYEHAFSAPGNYAYHCSPHPWMKAVVHVTGGSTPAPPPAATPTTQAAPSATTATTAPAARQAAANTPTTTAAPGGPSTTTTTAAATGGTTSTTAAAATPAAATASPSTPAEGSSTTTTTGAAAGGSGESAASTHRRTDSGETNGPMVALAAVLTMMLLGISGRLLLAKSRPH